MNLDVFALAPGRGTLTWRGGQVPCTLGRAGVRQAKSEGDGASPAGCFAFRRVLYRPDRLAPPVTRLPCAAIDPNDGWCDAPADPAYNRQIRLPYPASAERLWRDDRVYDIIVVLGHNDDPVVAGAGSAIFLHLAREDGGPTEGCVGLARAAMIELLAAVAPDDRLCIHPPAVGAF